MSINLSLIFSAPDGVISNQISYARIDNTNNPLYVQAGSFIVSPAIVATNVPNGQYILSALKVYADGRPCDPETTQTPACPGLVSISGFIQSGNLVVQYTAPSTVVKVRITIGYPNGGSNVANYVNDGNNITIALPSGLYGDYTIQGQSVCDEASGFYSPYSATAVATVSQPVAGQFSLSNTAGTVCSATPGTYYTNGAFISGATLFTDAALSNPVTGFAYVAFNNAIYNISGTSGLIGSATGQACGATITGSTGLTPGQPTSSGFIYAPAGSTVHVTQNAGGTSGGTYSLTINVPAAAYANTATNGVNTYTFIMPPAGVVAWSGNFTSSNGSGGSSVAVY